MADQLLFDFDNSDQKDHSIPGIKTNGISTTKIIDFNEQVKLAEKRKKNLENEILLERVIALTSYLPEV
jgi:hypothetical protein